jgi:hypothetical protein
LRSKKITALPGCLPGLVLKARHGKFPVTFYAGIRAGQAIRVLVILKKSANDVSIHGCQGGKKQQPYKSQLNSFVTVVNS